MPTTKPATNFAHYVYAIQARTDGAAAAIDDLTGPDFRVPNAIFANGGRVTDDAFRSVAVAGQMAVDVGSGTAGKDTIVVQGTSTGTQLPYEVTLNAATVRVPLDASSTTGSRIDELYCVVSDPPFTGGTLALPQLIVRKGDNGAGNPGPDAAWKNFELVGRYSIPQNSTSPTVLAGPRDAKLHKRLLAAHADTHAMGGPDSLSGIYPRTDVFVVPLNNYGPGNTTGNFVRSQTRTVSLPAAVGQQNIRVQTWAMCHYFQESFVTDPNGQFIYMRCVLNGQTGADIQEDSTKIPGFTGTIMLAEQEILLDAVTSFTVAIDFRHSVANGGQVRNINVMVALQFPRAIGSQAITIT